MHVCVHVMWRSHVVYLYIGIKPSSWWGRVERETWVVGVNSEILGGPRQTRRMLMKQNGRGLSSTLNWGNAGHIHEVLQEHSRSSMYRAMITQLCCKKKLSWVTCSMLSVINYDCSMIRKSDLHYWPMFIFRRLKINHDSNKFILEFWHHREHLLSCFLWKSGKMRSSGRTDAFQSYNQTLFPFLPGS
jgi:hypothetical protein